MKLELNIYERNKETRRMESKRTVKSNTTFITFGVVEDLLEIVKLDKIDLNNESDLINVLIGAVDEIKPLLLDTFVDDDLTEEELRNCKIEDIITVFINILTFAISNMMTKDTTKKK